jgi:hypothetical protein
MSTEALGHIYESAIINKETRKRWGTHSTPVVVDRLHVGSASAVDSCHAGNQAARIRASGGPRGFLVGALRGSMS